MKILMICTEKLPVPPVRGGAIQTYISGALPYLNPYHDITVLGVSDPSLPDQETINGVRYVRIPGKVFQIYKEGVVQYLRSNSFDLIHVFNRPKLILPIREVAPKARLTLSMHNDMFNPNKIDHDEGLKVIDEVSSIVTVSDYIGDIIQQQFPNAAGKLHTIYSGVDTDRFLPGHHPKMKKIREELRETHSLQNKTVILYAGRLSRNKGVDRLIRALPELTKKFKNLALVIVGSKWFSQNDVTDYVAYVRALAKKLPIPVVNTGFVSPAEIQNWFAAADLFVCTSVWQEPLARVHYEAMAAGLPIVTTARGGNPEVIRLNENGLIVEDPENPANFTEVISQLLSNPFLMKKMGNKGRELAVSLYEWDRVGNDILEVWEHAHEVVVKSTNNQENSEETKEVNEKVIEDQTQLITTGEEKLQNNLKEPLIKFIDKTTESLIDGFFEALDKTVGNSTLKIKAETAKQKETNPSDNLIKNSVSKKHESSKEKEMKSNYLTPMLYHIKEKREEDDLLQGLYTRKSRKEKGAPLLPPYVSTYNKNKKNIN